jgi:hypothetical protein
MKMPSPVDLTFMLLMLSILAKGFKDLFKKKKKKN